MRPSETRCSRLLRQGLPTFPSPVLSKQVLGTGNFGQSHMCVAARKGQPLVRISLSQGVVGSICLGLGQRRGLGDCLGRQWFLLDRHAMGVPAGSVMCA